MLILFLYLKENMKIVFVTKTAVNIEHMIPTLRVVAKPLIGPEPTNDNTKAVNRVVMLASKIVRNALLYAVIKLAFKDCPKEISSFKRSKIITFASTVIPIVNKSPAIPGSVKTAFIVTNTAKTTIIFIVNAKHAIKPDHL